MQPSRRAFLMGGRRQGGEWGRFYQRLARLVSGRLDDSGPAADGRPSARLRPARLADVLHARALCAELGVVLALDGQAVSADRPRLWVDVSALDTLQTNGAGLWRAEPGVRLGALRRHLPHARFDATDDTTVAAWLLGPAAARADLNTLAASGLATVDVLLADGAVEAFGPFGADARRAALSPAVSGLVSALFMLARAASAGGGQRDGAVMGRYRLDALQASAPNLAWLLAGSAGTLTWPQSLVFSDSPTRSAPAATAVGRAEDAAAGMSESDATVKRSFDPGGVYPHLPSAVV